MDSVWSRLSFYESTDHVKRAFQNTHGRELKTQHALEIVTNLAQGRQYMSIAQDAPDLVRPLLIYYGARGLARSLMLFKVPSMREATLKPSHGVEAIDWANKLGTGGMRNLLSLSLKVLARGTFPELVSAIGNDERVRTNIGSPKIATITSRGTGQIHPAVEFELKDLLLRVPDLAHLSDLVLPNDRKCYSIVLHPFFSGNSLNYMQVDLHHPPNQTLSEPAVRNIASISPDVALEPKRFPLADDDVSSKGWTWRTADIDGLPFILTDRFGFPYIVVQHSNGVKLSNLSTLYLLAFATGLLVRYHPATWFALIRGGPGDSAFPLLIAAVATAHERIPDLVLREFEDY